MVHCIYHMHHTPETQIYCIGPIYASTVKPWCIIEICFSYTPVVLPLYAAWSSCCCMHALLMLVTCLQGGVLAAMDAYSTLVCVWHNILCFPEIGVY